VPPYELATSRFFLPVTPTLKRAGPRPFGLRRNWKGQFGSEVYMFIALTRYLKQTERHLHSCCFEFAIACPFNLPKRRALTENDPESLGIGFGIADGRTIVAVTGCDARGMMFSLLELADCVRSMMRLFTSDVEDKPWFKLLSK